jgi:ABC-type sugar transport system permease subunit
VAESKALLRKRRRTAFFAYAMLAPDVMGLLVFMFLPIIMAFIVSLNSWDVLSPMRFIGFANYRTLIADSDWWRSLRTTVGYALMYVMMVFWFSLFLAVFINSLKRWQELFRTLNFIPFSISTVVAGMAWLFLLNDRTGYVNAALRGLGLPTGLFLGSTSQALPSIAVMTAWMNVGYYTIIFLAAIKDIPSSYFEAARIDGAGSFRMFWYITFPLLKNVSAFVLIITSIASFQVFDQIKIMTNGGPASATSVTVFYIFKQSFEFMKFGYASALAFILFLIIFAISMAQLRLTRAGQESD